MQVDEELDAAGLLQAPGRAARDLVYDDLSKLTYLNAVIDETMRMYPVGAAASVRECTRCGARSLDTDSVS